MLIHKIMWPPPYSSHFSNRSYALEASLPPPHTHTRGSPQCELTPFFVPITAMHGERIKAATVETKNVGEA